MLLSALQKAVRNLFLPGVIKLFLLCLLAYGVGLTLFSWMIGSILAALSGAVGAEGVFVQALGTLGGGVLAWFLFPLLYPILVSFFDDYMAESIEARDYPHIPKAEPPFWPTLASDIRFSLKAIGINVLCLPFYFIPLLGAGLYLGVNGYLLGAQFFRMAAGRRLNREGTEGLLKRHRGVIALAGAAVVLAGTVPILNLAAPLLGVATLLHLFHALNGTGKSELLPPR